MHPRFLLSWPLPWRYLFSILDGDDPLLAQARMRRLLKRPKNQRAEALREAQAAAAPFLSPGMSTRGLAEFWPTYATVRAAGDGPVAAFWHSLGIDARTFDEARQSPRLGQAVPVLRVWGALGLLWVLFIEALARDQGTCTRCGWLLTRTARRRVYGPQDDVACYRSRRRDEKRRQRAARRRTPDRR